MGYCKHCGICCKAIHIPYNFKDIEVLAQQGSNDAKFINENWIPITSEEAYKINLYLRNMKDKHEKHGLHFYKCTCLDKNTNLCSVYENRPLVCEGYPWYDDGINVHDHLYSDTCGFKLEQEEQMLRNIETEE